MSWLDCRLILVVVVPLELICVLVRKTTGSSWLWSWLWLVVQRVICVMVKNTTSNTKDKFIILNVFQNGDDALFYCCPVCNDKKIVESLTEGFNSQSMKHCLHSDVCQILWGNQYTFEKVAEEHTCLIEIIRQKPTYMAVVHPDI